MSVLDHRRNRIALALLLAPLAACGPLLGAAAIAFAINAHEQAPPTMWLYIAVFAIPIAYLVQTVVVWPAYVVLRRLALDSARNFALIGLFVGAAPLFVHFPVHISALQVLFVMMYPACGATVGYAFGFIVNAAPGPREDPSTAGASPRPSS